MKLIMPFNPTNVLITMRITSKSVRIELLLYAIPPQIRLKSARMMVLRLG
jgi:hypothetical protein